MNKLDLLEQMALERRSYMDSVSYDLKRIEDIIKKSGLSDFQCCNFEWKEAPGRPGQRRLLFLSDKLYVLTEAPFHIREQAHKMMDKFVDAIKSKLK